MSCIIYRVQCVQTACMKWSQIEFRWNSYTWNTHGMATHMQLHINMLYSPPIFSLNRIEFSPQL